MTSHTTTNTRSHMLCRPVIPAPSFHPLYEIPGTEDRTLPMAFKLTLKPQRRYIYPADAWWALDDSDSPAVLAWGPGRGVRAILNKRINTEWKTPVRLACTEHRRLSGHWEAQVSVRQLKIFQMCLTIAVCVCAINTMNNSLGESLTLEWVEGLLLFRCINFSPHFLIF